MWWERDAVNLLTDMGLTRTSAVSLVKKIKHDAELTASEAGMWAKVVTILGGAAVIASVVRPQPSTARLLSEVANSHTRMLRVAAGVPSRGLCHVEIWHPRPNSNPVVWDLIRCPLERGHTGMHADVNCYPFFTDEDAAFFNRQHALVTEV